MGEGSRLRPLRCLLAGVVVVAAATVAGCAAPVAGSARPDPAAFNGMAATVPPEPTSTSTSGSPSTTRPPSSAATPSSVRTAARQVNAACPLLSADEVGTIYDLTVGFEEGPPLTQGGATVYNCSFVNGAKQKLAALQVVVNPSAGGDARHYLDSYLHPFLTSGANPQQVSGVGAAAESYVMSNNNGPLAFVLAAVQPVGSTLDIVQFIVSSANAGDPTALHKMIGILSLALGRL